ncbi:hypothetical protein K438DRAFT_1807634 [Mycena galopus ATCC 62051]|nr:hypothetical protein K438DRAFT_1807634 [Mycena galopus ATCC 62051]
MTVTTPPTSDHGHAVYTDQDWANELQWLAKAMQKPKRMPIIPPPQPQRVSRPPTPSIMMSMTALLEEDEDGPLVPPKHTPRSNVIVSSRSSTPPLSASHRRASSLSTTVSSPASYHPPPALLSGPPELPSYGTPAYTSLVVPPAPFPSQPLVRSSSISQRFRSSLRRDTADLSRSRLAQATMASIEVVGGLASPSHHQPPRLGFTHYRSPPSVPKSSVLVQVWAVGLDAVDLRLLGVQTPARPEFKHTRTQSFGRFVGRTISRRTASDVSSIFEKDKDSKEAGHPAPQVGFIPGRSFVGRVVECGWDVRDEIARRSEWVVGLLDIRKSGALAEFITVDRHRIHRVPHPHIISPSSSDSSFPGSSAPSSASSEAAHPHPRPHSQALSHSNQESPYPSRPSSVSFTLDTPPPSRPSSRLNRRSAPPAPPPPPPGLDLAELALLPLAGIAAHRAVRTLYAVDASKWCPDAVTPEGEVADPMDSVSVKSARARKGKRRALVLHGHAGTGGLVARILARRGWHVCVHAPGSVSASDSEDAEDADRAHMRRVQERVRAWGVEEVVFDDGGCAADCSFESGDGGRGNGAAVRAVERLIADRDEFDAVVDTIGGKEVWDAGERLLARGEKTRGQKQFTTTVGDWPARPVPTAKDNFRAGLRALTWGNGASNSSGEGKKSKKAKKEKENKKAKGGSVVSYAWVSAAQDVDWEGEDVRDSLAAVVRIALEEGARPVVEGTAMPFERAAEVFEGREGSASGGVLKGGSVVVRVVG